MDPLGLKRLTGVQNKPEPLMEVKKSEDKDDYKLLHKLEELEEENKRLRNQLLNLQFRSSFPLSIVLLSVGGAALLAAYAYDSLILTFTGLGLILWGAVVFYSLPRKMISEKTLYSSVTIIRSLSSIIQNLGYKGRAIFFYPNTLSGLANGYVFIPADDKIELPTEDKFVKEEFMIDNGLLIPAHAQSIVRLFEHELNTNLLTLELADVQSKIEQFFVEDLRMIDGIKFDVRSDMITVTIESSNMAHICREVNNFDENHLGCPLCSSLALMLSRVVNIPVIIEETATGSEKIRTRYRLLENGI